MVDRYTKLVLTVMAICWSGSPSVGHRSSRLRTTFLAFLITLGLAVSAFAQSLLQVDITEGEFRAGMQAVTTPYATGGPWAAIPARALKSDVTPTVTDFRIRTWVEGEGVRVIVFAVTRKPGSPLDSDDERETQIASVALTAGQAVVIDATEKYNARRVTLTARKPLYTADAMRKNIATPSSPAR